MQHLSMSIPLTLFCILLFCLVIFLLVQNSRLQNQSSLLLRTLLKDQLAENQSLRNQLRSADVPTLVGLNHATLPSDAVASNEASHEPIDLGEAIDYEEELAKQGYSLGDLGNDLESAGWVPAAYKRNSDGEPIAFDGGI